MAEIIEINDFRVLRKRRTYSGDSCKHLHMTLDDDGEFVTCDDCKMQVGNYAALRMFIERWSELQQRVDGKRQVLAEAEKRTLTLRAAQRVEKAWRSRTMMPTCPHCREAIFPGDGFGGSAVNNEIAMRRRAAIASMEPKP